MCVYNIVTHFSAICFCEYSVMYTHTQICMYKHAFIHEETKIKYYKITPVLFPRSPLRHKVQSAVCVCRDKSYVTNAQTYYCSWLGVVLFGMSLFRATLYSTLIKY